MAVIKSPGIIFKVLKYRETSIITDIYTRELGLRSYIINGVRKTKSSFPAALFQVGNILDLIVYEKNSNKLNRIKEARVDYAYLEVPYKIEKSSVQVFIMELLGKCIKEHEANYDLYDFIRKELEKLDKLKSGVQYFHLKLILELSTFLGFRPLNNFGPTKPYFNLQEGLFEAQSSPVYHIDEKRSQYISRLLESSYQELPDLQITKPLRISLIEDLLKFYQYHIEGFSGLKSFEIYRQLF